MNKIITFCKSLDAIEIIIIVGTVVLIYYFKDDYFNIKVELIIKAKTNG